MNATVAASAEDADTLDAEDDDDVDRANRTMHRLQRGGDPLHEWSPRVDYGSYNMHFGAVHATPFWREQNIIKTVKRYL